MASNNYQPYSYPYQQTTAQGYPSYQPMTTQPSYPSQPYGEHGSAYGGVQSNTWGTGNYAVSRETTNRAAEVLHHMSNTPYTSNKPSTSEPNFAAANTATSRYSSNQPQSQARRPSVGANHGPGPSSNRGRSSPAITASYAPQRSTGQQQRPMSPGQGHYAQNTQTSISAAKSAAVNATTSFNEYQRGHFPNLDASRNTSTAASSSHNYGDIQPTANSAPETYNQGSTTVDPMAVYDPWPEYQRKQEALRAQKAAENAARAEEERKAEEARKQEEQRKEEEEEEERIRLAQMSESTPQRREPTTYTVTTVDSSNSDKAGVEAEIRALMAKMRELNSKDPAMLARIWEEERRAKAPKSPIIQSGPAPQPTSHVQPAQANEPAAANQRKKAVPKDVMGPTTAKPATVVKAQPITKPPMAVPSSQSSGNTIWPQEKKAQLALTASIYLNRLNPNSSTESDQVVRMLDKNPSYIELCEQLEGIGLKLDRAAFARSLLSAVPDVNSATRTPKPTARPTENASMPKTQVAPPAIMKRNIGLPATPSTGSTSPAMRQPELAAPTPVRAAEMVPLKAELKPPPNKEEAARKRSFNDLIDLTQISDDEFDPPPKRPNIASAYSAASPVSGVHGTLNTDSPTNFPIPVPPQPVFEHIPAPVNELRHYIIVQPLERKKALRRNNYNIKTIARDVLLACGRHPETRQLNQHLEILKSTLAQVTDTSDLSTLRWDLIDPGNPPPGYFKDSVQGIADDADDEEDSEDEQPARRLSTATCGTGHEKVQAPTEAINPFKQPKRRGRPPRHSYPGNPAAPATPQRAASHEMTESMSRPASAGVSYSAFRAATEYDADGKPLPKKRGRPVGWRKHIHGSAAAQIRSQENQHAEAHRFAPSQPSSLRNVRTGNRDNSPIQISSRSPSISQKPLRYQSFKCQWQNCKAELHNLETLKKHVHKIHRKQTGRGVECLWADCGKEVDGYDMATNTSISRLTLKVFPSESEWQEHLEQNHFRPLSWKLGDGPASGLSDATDSEAYLSDAHGRRVTPRIYPRQEYSEDYSLDDTVRAAHATTTAATHGRGRPPKVHLEQEARNEQSRLISRKKRVGGPGIDRGGATLVNEKRRRGFSDNDETEELVDAED